MKGRLIRLLGQFVLQQATVLGVDELGPQFRRVRFRAPGVTGEPGDKIQVLLPGDDMRTYTPIGWAPDGTSSFLVFLHAETPSTRWGRAVAAGDALRFVGPQRSVSLADGPVVIVGDETSLGVAASYAATRANVSTVLEIAPGVDVQPALAALKLTATVVPRGSPDALLDAVSAAKGAIALTGSGELIHRVRTGLRARSREVAKAKAYWIEGKVALD